MQDDLAQQAKIRKGSKKKYTPKHASWLNAAEIEIDVMDIECTDRRIEDMEILAYEVAAWTKGRNDDEKKINWEFRAKMPTRNCPSIMFKN